MPRDYKRVLEATQTGRGARASIPLEAVMAAAHG